jgi:Copper amine oxidase N-terminal domain
MKSASTTNLPQPASAPEAPAERRPLLPGRNLVVATALVATVAAMVLSASRPASLTVDGQRIVSDVPPVTQAHEAFVPLRAVADGLGADTDYDPRTGTVELTRGNDVLRMRVGDTHATVNGKKVTLAHAPFAVRGRTMVGLGLIARAFGSQVRYDRTSANIDVVTRGALGAGTQQDTP